VDRDPAPLHACERAVGDWLNVFKGTAFTAAVNPPAPLGVAFSGGADSTALLLAVKAQWAGPVEALHVHHGLQAAADGFEAHARKVCESLGVALHVARVDARASAGQSPEEAARNARYEALASLARQSASAFVLLGQHADDQAETLLLALSRGAGLPGLASMAERFERHGVWFGRPLLALPGAELRDYVAARGFEFVDDPSNCDERYTRNRIRHQLMPAWERCFPGFRPMLARSAQHAAQAQGLLDELAQLDLSVTGTPPSIRGLQSLSQDRQANAVRYWLRGSAGVAPSAAQLGELLDQIADCTTRGHHIRLKVAEAFVYRQGACLAYGTAI
jgi:tRNA(Ile)-lysidine synthase